MDWTLVTKSAKQKKWKIQISVKVNGSRTMMMEKALSDKVNDIVKRIPTNVCCDRDDIYIYIYIYIYICT